MTVRWRVGTRRSPLALAQTDLVLRRLARRFPRAVFRTVPIVTSGDRDLSAGGSPDFTDAIDRALRRGEVDLAVHSAKDVESRLPDGVELAAFLPRGDPRDCLVVRPGRSPARLPLAARVGSSSPRRRAQLLRRRPDLEVREVRGNVDSRLKLLRDGDLDGIVVAVAGLERLRRNSEIGRVMSLRDYLPAPAQGAIAVAVRAGDGSVRPLVDRIDHAPTRIAVTAERAFAAELGGDCRLPLAALATVRGGAVSLVGEVLSPDGRRRVRAHRRGRGSDPDSLGRSLARTVRELGGRELLAASR